MGCCSYDLMIRTLAALPEGCQFPAPITGDSQFPVTSVIGDWMPYSGLDWHW